jgi:hypothetical protein
MAKEYVIRIEAIQDCWIADWQGDPGRTLVWANAKRFEKPPVKEVLRLFAKYPNRVFIAEPEETDK